MKKIIYILLTLPLILFSCEKNPVASFSTDSGEVVVGQPVVFHNNSQNSDRFEWDFGDGFVSNESNPIHTFTATGTSTVTLTAISKGGHSDNTSLTFDIVIPTLLEIEVREYYSEDLIPDASIILYPTLTDWDAQTNKIVEGFADADGVAVFSNLDPYVYYVDVWEATHDNYTLRNEDVGFIRTPEITPHKINRFIAWVDVADHSSSKGAARGNREMIIKKLERKVSDKRQPAAVPGVENWQELYKRSVSKK
jgi:hypothetical protein